MRAPSSLRSTRGATLVEVIVVIGVVALVAIVAFRLFGKDLIAKSKDEGQKVAALDAEKSGKPGAPLCTGGTCAGGSSCFVAGTPVLTPEGLQPIDQITAGDTVLSADEVTGEVLAKHVAATFVSRERDVVDVYVGDQRPPLRATPGHLFFTLDRGWIPTEKLVPGEPLVDAAGAARAVDHVDTIATRETVYNFEVEDTHTYFVGEARVLVHNPNHAQGQGRLQPAPAQPDPELQAVLGLGTQYHVPQLPPNSAVVELSNDYSALLDAQQYSAAHGVPVYFSYNLDPSTPAPRPQPGKPPPPLGGVVYVPSPHGLSIVPANGGGTLGYIPNALDGKGTLVLGSHGWPGWVQWGGPLKQGASYSSKISGEDLVGRLINAGYQPAAVDSNSHVYALPCNVCTEPSGGPSVAQQVALAFHVPTEGLQQVPGKSGENAAGPASYENPPGVPHVPIKLASGEQVYLVQQVADDNGQYVTCTPN